MSKLKRKLRSKEDQALKLPRRATSASDDPVRTAEGEEEDQALKLPRRATSASDDPVRTAEGEEEAPSFELERETEAGSKEHAEVDVDTGVVKVDRRGIVHLASVPRFMKFDKVRSEMEKFGEVGRIYLEPEDKTRTTRRKKFSGKKQIRFIEGWIEFAERKIAKRVAMTLNGTPLGGRKRHNFWRDEMWNLKYLPRFKWHQLKEAEIYNSHVRKARLTQKMSQARRENTLFLDRVEKAKGQKFAAERIAAKAARSGQAGDTVASSLSAKSPPKGGQVKKAGKRAAKDWNGAISDRVLDSLF